MAPCTRIVYFDLKAVCMGTLGPKVHVIWVRGLISPKPLYPYMEPLMKNLLSSLKYKDPSGYS